MASIQSIRLPSEKGEDWISINPNSGPSSVVEVLSRLCPPAPVQEIDPVEKWFCLPEGTEIAAVHLLKLRFKSLAFTSSHVLAKFLPGNTGAFTMIASVKEALALPTVVDSFENTQRYAPVPVKLSKQAIFQAVSKVFSEKVVEATGWSPDIVNQAFQVTDFSQATNEFIKNPGKVKPKTPVCHGHFLPKLNLLRTS